jgi:hypothetical protein
MPTKIVLFRPKALSWKDINPPAGWTWSLPFTIQQKGRSFRVKAGWTIDQNKPTGKTYYVSTTGNDANDGLTPGTALRKIYTAFMKADVDVVSIAAGAYGWSNGWAGQNLTRSVSFIPTGGRVVIGTFA